jgi:hypothetical protein
MLDQLLGHLPQQLGSVRLIGSLLWTIINALVGSDKLRAVLLRRYKALED